MKKYLLIPIFILLFFNFVNAQVKRLAIIDFDNISGIAKYDGLGKAMSSMLISDIEANVSPKRLQLVERAQIQKVLKEQNFQASGNVDKNTAVQAGKLLGVNYLLIGDVYILNDELIINARLINTETGDIVFSKKQEGKTVGWLTLKTNIAKDLASGLSQPFTVPTIPDKEIPMATITTFGNAIVAKDIGDTTLAEKLIETVQDFSPEFKYIDEIKKEIENLRKDVEKIKIDVDEAVENPYILAHKYLESENYSSALKYFKMANDRIDPKDPFGANKKIFTTFYMAYVDYNLANYKNSLLLVENCIEQYPYFYLAKQLKIELLCKLKKYDIAQKEADKFISNWEYFYGDTLNLLYPNFNIIGNQLHDGYRNNENNYTFLDMYLRNRGDVISVVISSLDVCGENAISEKSFSEKEMMRLKSELLKANPNLQKSLNNNYFWIGHYFSLVNRVCWEKIKNNNIKEAKYLLLENINYISLLSPNEINTNYHLAEEIIPEMKVKNTLYLSESNPDEVLAYLLGNLALCYAFEKDLEKVKVLYSLIGYEVIIINNSYHKLNIENPQEFKKIFQQDCKDLGIQDVDFNDLNKISLIDKVYDLIDNDIKLNIRTRIEYDHWKLSDFEKKQVGERNKWFNSNSDVLLKQEKTTYELVINNAVSPWRLIFLANGKFKITYNETEIIGDVSIGVNWYENIILQSSFSDLTPQYKNDFNGFCAYYDDKSKITLNIEFLNFDKLVIKRRRDDIFDELYFRKL
jgi:TolB-like protein